MTITDELDDALRTAMRSGDTAGRDAIRLAQTRIREAELAGARPVTLDDDAVIDVLRRCVRACGQFSLKFVASRPDEFAWRTRRI